MVWENTAVTARGQYFGEGDSTLAKDLRQREEGPKSIDGVGGIIKLR